MVVDFALKIDLYFSKLQIDFEKRCQKADKYEIGGDFLGNPEIILYLRAYYVTIKEL